MKICWDNLEKLKYRPDRGEWQKKWKNVFYVYKESCQKCGKPFLARKDTYGLFCDHSCASSGNNIGNKRSEKSKKKQSISMKGEKNPAWKGGVIKNDIPLYNTYAHQISFCEEVRRNKENRKVLEVKCAYCGNWFMPTKKSICNRIVSLNGKGTPGSEGRLYCSTQCKQECPIYRKIKFPDGFKPATSREVQPELRQMCFERDNYTCQKCNKHQNKLNVGLQCHHIEGIRWEPLESADLDRVTTFCKDCHKEVHKLPDCGYYDLRCK